jgi:hypothetical protein
VLRVERELILLFGNGLEFLSQGVMAVGALLLDLRQGLQAVLP